MSKSNPDPRSVLAHAMTPGLHGAKTQHVVAITERRLAIVQLTARHGQSTALNAVGVATFGGDLPSPGRALIRGDSALIWIQPGSWLACGPWVGEGVLAARISQAVGDKASVVDQTCGTACIRISGAKARDVLAKGCRIDLHPRVFQPGSAAVTPVAHTSCTLVQIDTTPAYDLILPSTLAESFLEWLELSAAEFGYVIT